MSHTPKHIRGETVQHVRDPGCPSPTWLVCGSSPSARRGMVAALDEWHPQITITCNGGHRLFDTRTGLDAPTFYFLTDIKACEIYAADAWYMQDRFDTMILTPERLPSAIASRGLDKADQFIEVDGSAPTMEHTPGKVAPHPLSGLYMLDIALNRGARTVLLVGYDGYRSGPDERHIDYFDGRTGHGRSYAHNERMERYLRTAVERRPDVRFVMYGEPMYKTPESDRFELRTPGGVSC